MPWSVPLKIAKELLYTGKMITAQRAYEIGMVNEVVPRQDLERSAHHHTLMISKPASTGFEDDRRIQARVWAVGAERASADALI
jgi:enoyl-CoA hydratase